MRAKEFVPKESNRTRFADGYLAFSDHFEDRLRERNISKSDVLRLLHKLEVTRSIDLIRMPYVSFTAKSHNLGLAFHKQLDKHGNTAYVIATAHPTLRAGEDEDVIYLEEDASVDADRVLDYVKRTHAPDEFNIEYSITDHPRWELKNIPLSQLKLDPDGEQRDPYNRVNWVDYDTVDELMPKIASVLKVKPIVVDAQGWIIDGNHRATAAAEAGLTSVPAYVPAEVNENFADGRVKGKSRPGRVKRAGASCDGSVSSLRAKARKYGGERGKMYHWCANMKGGKKKANEDDESYDGPYDGHNFGGAQIG